MVANSSPREFTFIVATDRKKPDGETRKVIRREVMKGKNKGRVLPPRRPKRETKRSPKENLGQETQFGGEDEDEEADAPSSSVPARIGSERSFFQVAGERIDPSILIPILHFATEAKPAMFVLQRHVDFPRNPTHWSEALASDPAYLHAVLSVSHSYFDTLSGLDPTIVQAARPSYHYTSRCLQILRERLTAKDDSLKLTDTTLMAILCLASYSNKVRQHETSCHHLRGLRKIIELRGGLRSVRGNSKLLIEIFRCDITLALDSGMDPIFFHDTHSEPFLPYLDRLSGFLPPGSALSVSASSLGISDSRLARAWDTTATFCSLVKYAASEHRMIPQQTFLNTMASVMYRLLAIDDLLQSNLDGALRLGLLGFCSRIFVQWPKMRIPHQHLSHLYKNCLLDLRSTGEANPRVMLWLVIIGHIAVFRAESEPWLVPWVRDAIQACGFKTWEEVQAALNNYLWLGCVHDELGKAIFDQASTLDSQNFDFVVC